MLPTIDLDWLALTTAVVTTISVLALFIAIIVDFAEGSGKRGKQEKRSVVDTGTMLAFFLGYCLLLRFHVLTFPLGAARVGITLCCLLIISFGAAFNIWGRFNLGANWANQIKIYSHHTLVRHGAYALVRHPLYASLLWMLLAAGILFHNLGALLATLLVFLPFMRYRARQEERLLEEQFKEYKNYRRNVGMFFPRIRGRR